MGEEAFQLQAQYPQAEAKAEEGREHHQPQIPGLALRKEQIYRAMLRLKEKMQKMLGVVLKHL